MVNSLDMQLSEFTYMTRLPTKQDRENRIEVTESGARDDTEMIPVVPFLCKKVRLRLEECGCHEGLTNATKASLYSPITPATKA